MLCVFAVFAPVVVTGNVTMTITTAAGYSHSADESFQDLILSQMKWNSLKKLPKVITSSQVRVLLTRIPLKEKLLAASAISQLNIKNRC